MRTCMHCGTEVSDTAKFCRKCGAKLELPLDAIDETDENDEIDEIDEITPGAQATDTPGQDMGAEAPAEDLNEIASNEAAPVWEPQEGEPYAWGAPTGAPEDYGKPSMPPVVAPGTAWEETPRQDGPQAAEKPAWDHSANFEAQDIADNKVLSMAAYLLGALGIIIALLAGRDSAYTGFHVRQAMKFVILEALLGIAGGIIIAFAFLLTSIPGLAVTMIITRAWLLLIGIALAILEVLKLISFVSVCQGRATEPVLLRSFGFLK